MRVRIAFTFAAIVSAVMLLAASIPAQASSRDYRIESSAKKSYVFKNYLNGDAIVIQSRDGVVTLTGTVSEESHRSMAEETVTNLPGVRSVDNQLNIIGSPTTANSDPWLRDRVRGNFRFHRSVDYDNTDVTVVDGRVTLRGHADNEAQRQRTTEYAQDVSGVRDVDNQMTVSQHHGKSYRTMGQIVDDASITTQVRMSLLFHHGTDVFDTKVSTHNGVVTLRGSAKDRGERDLATRRANDVHGVRSVKNQMTIAVLESSSN